VRVQYACRAKGGNLRIIEGRQRWNLYVGESRVGQYLRPEDAVFALSATTVRWPPGVDPNEWKAPTGLGGWAKTIVPELPEED
jgi:hypothetical protein